MDKSFWIQKWKENNIGFHNSDFNELLLKNIEKISLKKSANILVPLCGKSLDLIYLAKLGHKVFGIELSDKAVISFFKENRLEYTKKTEGPFIRYLCQDLNIEILQGDFFEAEKFNFPPIDFVYDRASLIALPSDMRVLYANLLAKILPSKSQMLLISMEYNHDKLIGPPFSVTEKEIRELYRESFEITLLENLEKEIENSRFKELGVQSGRRLVFKLVKK